MYVPISESLFMSRLSGIPDIVIHLTVERAKKEKKDH